MPDHSTSEPDLGVPIMKDLAFERTDPQVMLTVAAGLARKMAARRSVRQFSTDHVERSLIEQAIEIGASAPSGAHRQPWTFVVVQDPTVRRQIRTAAEAEEREFYDGRAPEEWLRALAPLGTDAVKHHLTDAPYLVVMFKHRFTPTVDGGKSKNYYATESCGIAAGFFIAALHQIGLATLPHTPSPMAFLGNILERPEHEQAYLVLPVGYPTPDARVPDIDRKALADVLVWV